MVQVNCAMGKAGVCGGWPEAQEIASRWHSIGGVVILRWKTDEDGS